MKVGHWALQEVGWLGVVKVESMADLMACLMVDMWAFQGVAE